MPRVWFPDIDPEASNTSIASSLQADDFLSSARDIETWHAKAKPKAGAASLMPRKAKLLPQDDDAIAECSPERFPTLAKTAEGDRGTMRHLAAAREAVT
jgi:hypothetical protein